MRGERGSPGPRGRAKMRRRKPASSRTEREIIQSEKRGNTFAEPLTRRSSSVESHFKATGANWIYNELVSLSVDQVSSSCGAPPPLRVYVSFVTECVVKSAGKWTARLPLFSLFSLKTPFSRKSFASRRPLEWQSNRPPCIPLYVWIWKISFSSPIVDLYVRTESCEISVS